MRVAVFGAGYAGLTLARQLEDSLPEAVELVVVDESGDHVLQHEIHRVVRRPTLADDIRVDLGRVLDRAECMTARVTNVDPATGAAELDGGRLTYDYAAVCLGARTAFHDLPGVEKHATPLKRIADAEQIRERFLEVASRAREPDRARVIVGGAGLSGVQVAGELAALAGEEGVGDAVSVVLLEQEGAVAPLFPENFQRTVRDQLEARDVRVRTGAAVESATGSAVELATGETVGYDQFVWTGGIRGSAPLGGERPVVRKTLRRGDGTFLLGDAARVVDTDGEAVPASAQAAVREARVAATNVARLVDHDLAGGTGFEPRLDGYTFDSPGWLVSVGDGAVAQIGPTVLTGHAAKALKTSVGAGYLTSVGAVENALDLVREELGWTGSETDKPGTPVEVDVEGGDHGSHGESDRDDDGGD
jgi:NADH dehydrogenase